MKIALYAALIVLLHGLASYVINLPRDVGLDVPDGKLNSLSFAPFREGQNPLLLEFPTPEQIDEDMALMAKTTHTIRTYSITRGMNVIPEIARKHGLKMILGGWVGYELDDTAAEMEALIAAANQYPDVVKRVMVGNEVLLRGERSPEDLIDYIRYVKQRVKQPVSYADVWSMYMKHPELIKEVDFITIHILPYWEDEPIPVEKAAAHIERIYQQVRKEADSIAPGKPILIGETGWPSAGRQRGWAVPGVVNEASFIRQLLKVAAANGFDVNIVEAFNQPWKSELEGVIGANWGLFSSDRTEVFPLTGAVYENAKWLDQFVMASLLMLLVVLGYINRQQKLKAKKTLIFLAFIQILCAVLVYQADFAWYTSYSNWQRLQTVLLVLMNVAAGILLIQRAYDVLAGADSAQIRVRALDSLYLLIVGLCIYKTFLLAVDGRYISFPFGISAMPVLGLIGLSGMSILAGGDYQQMNYNRLIGYTNSFSTRNKQIGCVLLIYVIGLVIGEIKAFMVGRDFIDAYPDILDRLKLAIAFTVTNTQLVAWLVCLLVFAGAFMVGNPAHPYRKQTDIAPI